MQSCNISGAILSHLGLNHSLSWAQSCRRPWARSCRRRWARSCRRPWARSCRRLAFLRRLGRLGFFRVKGLGPCLATHRRPTVPCLRRLGRLGFFRVKGLGPCLAAHRRPTVSLPASPCQLLSSLGLLGKIWNKILTFGSFWGIFLGQFWDSKAAP